ncbi:MAG: hypothetical protein WAL49_05125 [Pseudolabrys sp.]
MAFPGAAGVSLAVAGGASATVSTANVPPRDTELRPVITLDEEEISDVSLGARSMSSTRKPPEHLSSAKAYNLPPAAEVAAVEAAEAAQFEAAEAAAAQVAEAA